MIHWLIYAGLVVTPFIWANGQVDPAREPKMAWAVVFALLISCFALYKGKLKEFKNKYAIALVPYIFIAFYCSPKPDLKMFGVPSGRFWSWEPLFYSVVFLSFLITVSSLNFTKRRIDILFELMITCGCITAGMVALESFNITQFFEWRYGTYGNLCGMLGNPTLVGPFLGMIIPLALFRKNYPAAILMLYASIRTCSNVAFIGIFISLAFYLATKSKRFFIIVTTLFVLSSSVFLISYSRSSEMRQMFPDNERFLTWKLAMQDLSSPPMQNSKKKYMVTGLGIGSFKYLYHAKHNNGFMYAHNEYVNCAYEIGFIGIILFLLALLKTFWLNFSIKRIFNGTESRYKRALMTSLVCACVCAGGIFNFQIGTHIFYGLIIVGLLHNSYQYKEKAWR